MSSNGTTPRSPPTAAAYRRPNSLALSCRECQRRKVKCDRSYPCGQCARAALVCVPSTRKPRAKVGAKIVDTELRARIAKLEKLVQHFQGEGGEVPPEDQPEPAPKTHTPTSLQADEPVDEVPMAPAPAPSSQDRLAGNFWHSLVNEVRALKDMSLADDDGSDAEQSSSLLTSPAPYQGSELGPDTSNYELIFTQPGALFVMPGAITELDDLTAMSLVDMYLDHVEPSQKLFHVPTLRELTHYNRPYLSQDADALCNKALKACIYFCGATAVLDEECEQMYGKPRAQLLQELRKTADLAIYHTDPLNTTSVATIQALVLYISGIRMVDNSRRAWSLVAAVARIARAINCHRDLPGESIFAAEIRRRLWYNIVFLDAYSSWDRGSEPALHPDHFSRQMPTNVNDTDFGPTSTTLTARVGEVTDMSLALMSQRAAVILIKLVIPPKRPSEQTWQQRLDWAYEFQKEAHEKYLQFCDPAIPRDRGFMGIGIAICRSIFLLAVRPTQIMIAEPPRIDSPWVLQLAVNILKQAEVIDFDITSGTSRRVPWIQWHALAVTLAGLCSVRDTELSTEGWRLVDKLMIRYAPVIADNRRGSLWRPIEELRKKAAMFRDAGVVDVETSIKPHFHEPLILQHPPAPAVGPMQPQVYGPSPFGAFDLPPEINDMTVPDNSWEDWENIMKDMDDFGLERMQWAS